jgi:WD40 repeat protein
MSDVFISYAREDEEFVRELAEALTHRGKSVWVDWEGIAPTVDWWNEICRGIEGSSLFLIVLSPDSVRSEVCTREIDHAVGLNKRIVPLLRRDVDGLVVPHAIASRNWVPFRAGGAFEPSLDHVVEAMELDPDQLEGHTRWLVRALEWERSNRDGSRLIRGAELEAAEEWLANATAKGGPPAPTALHRELILASRRGATRRRRVVVGAACAALGVAAVLATVAFTQRGEKVAQERLALSRNLLRAAGRPGQPLDRAILLTLEAHRRKPTSDTRSRLVALALRGQNLVRLLASSRTGVLKTAFSPDGRLVAIGGKDGRVFVHEASTGRALGKPFDGVGRAAFGPDSNVLAVAGRAGIELWQLSPRTRLASVETPGVPAALAVGPGAKSVVEVTENGRVADWETAAGRLHERVRLAGSFVAAADISAGGDTIVLGGPSGLMVIRGNGPAVVVDRTPQRDVALAPSARTVAAVANNGVLAIWDLRSGKRLASRTGVATARAVAFSPDGARLAVGEEDGTVTVAPAAAPREQLLRLRAHAGDVLDVAFSPRGGMLASGSLDRTAAIWTPGRSALARRLPSTGDPVLDLDFEPDGRRVAAAGFGSQVALWDLLLQASRPRTLRVEGPSFAQTEVAFDRRTGRLVAAPDGAAIATVELPSGTAAPVPGARRTGPGLAVSPDGSTLAWGRRDAGVGVLALPGGPASATRVPLAGAPVDLAFGNDARTLAAATSDGIQVVDVKTGKSLFRPIRGEAGLAVSLDRRGGLLVAATNNRTLAVWDLDARRLVGTRRGPGGDVALSPDGKTVAATTADRKIVLWDVPSRSVLGEPFDSGVTTLAFSLDGKTLAAGSGGITLWDRSLWGPPRALESFLCARVGRGLTPSEWEEYLPGERHRPTCDPRG